MNFLIVLLTTVLLLDCLLLILLVLIQLPKKEAGAALAFGAGATDALFGSGSGNALTKITKYSAGVFFALVILLSILTQATLRHDTSGVEQQLKQDVTKLNEARAAAVPATNSSPFKLINTNAPAATTAPKAPAAPQK